MASAAVVPLAATSRATLCAGLSLTFQDLVVGSGGPGHNVDLAPIAEIKSTSWTRLSSQGVGLES
jgi:hypothetical protein